MGEGRGEGLRAGEGSALYDFDGALVITDIEIEGFKSFRRLRAL